MKAAPGGEIEHLRSKAAKALGGGMMGAALANEVLDALGIVDDLTALGTADAIRHALLGEALAEVRQLERANAKALERINRYALALHEIATEDYRGGRPPSVRIAQAALSDD